MTLQTNKTPLLHGPSKSMKSCQFLGGGRRSSFMSMHMELLYIGVKKLQDRGISTGNYSVSNKIYSIFLPCSRLD